MLFKNPKLRLLFSKKTLLAIPQTLLYFIPLWAFTKLTGVKKNCWLICERPKEARDNGFVLLQWLKDNHPAIHAIYAIKKSCPDAQKLKGKYPCVEYGSMKHWFYYFKAEAICDTSWGICCPNEVSFLLMRNILPATNKRIFLQHGITKDFMHQGTKEKLKCDLFVCGAKPEYEYIAKNFGYKSGEVQYLGFPRFDRLTDTSTKSASNRTILFMPTWRMTLNDTNLKNSQYFSNIVSLFSSPTLNEWLTLTKTSLVYYLHPAITKYAEFFSKYTNRQISVKSNTNSDLQEYICSANLLITDYSSIYFDFAYQNKPVIYYQFDYEDYRKHHYTKGYFDYDNHGFGPVCKTQTELIDWIIRIMDKDEFPEIYRQRVSAFFPIKDQNNSERNFDAIISTIHNK